MTSSTSTPSLKPAFAWSRKDWPSESAFQDPTVQEAWCYTDRFSYLPGEIIDFHLSSNAERFSMTLLRDGAEPECCTTSKTCMHPPYLRRPTPTPTAATGRLA